MASICDNIDDARGRLAHFIEELPLREITPSICQIDEVPGAFILHHVLSVEECDELQKLVQNVTQFIENKEVLLSPTDKPRRNSQHHTPCHVESKHLLSLSARLRPFLPQVAGPSLSCCDTVCELEEIGSEISTFLRCYHYRVGDFSTPHYDRSQYEYQDIIPKSVPNTSKDSSNVKVKSRPPCKLVRFSAFSIILYLNDDFTGGATTFLSPVSHRKEKKKFHFFSKCFFSF